MKSRLAAKFLAVSHLRPLLASVLRPRGILVLNYHRIGDGSASPYDRELWSAATTAFDEQVAFLARHCDVIAPADIDQALGNPRGRHVIITFDDGYRDNHDHAFRILRSHRVPATFFVATGFIDRPTLPWWDEIASLVRRTQADRLLLSGYLAKPIVLDGDQRDAVIHQLLETYKALPSPAATELLAQLRSESEVDDVAIVRNHWMTWDMIRDMHAHGMTIGGHTMNHPVLSRMSAQQQYDEIAGCGARIRDELGVRMDYFAYPVGGRDAFNADTVECLKRLEVRHAFSYYGGFVTRASPRYDMPRVAIEPHVGTDLFRAMAQLPQVFCRRAYN